MIQYFIHKRIKISYQNKYFGTLFWFFSSHWNPRKWTPVWRYDNQDSLLYPCKNYLWKGLILRECPNLVWTSLRLTEALITLFRLILHLTEFQSGTKSTGKVWLKKPFQRSFSAGYSTLFLSSYLQTGVQFENSNDCFGIGHFSVKQFSFS